MVIAKGAVAIKNAPPYVVVAGATAKVIRYCFDEKTNYVLKNSHWWKMLPEDLMQFYTLIERPLE